MKKNIIANLVNILIWISFVVIVIFIKVNPLSVIISFIIAAINVLVAVYSMGNREYPKIKIGNLEGSVLFCNMASFIIQLLLVFASLSSSFWILLIAIFSVFIFIECIMVFYRELFYFLRFHIAITFTISLPTLLLYSIFLAYRKYNIKLPTTIIAIVLIAVYIILIYKEKNTIKVTAYSSIFSMSLIILSIGDFTSQGIFSSILYLISFIPVMFMLMTASYSISDTYNNNGVSGITSVFVHLPMSGAGYFVGLLGIMGFPPFSLFFGRLSIIQSAVTSGDYVRAALIAIAIILSTYYVLSKVMPVLFGIRQNNLIGIKENKYSVFILLLLGTLSLLLTILIPGFINDLINNARAYVMGVL